jgi:hypothetical protein
MTINPKPSCSIAHVDGTVYGANIWSLSLQSVNAHLALSGGSTLPTSPTVFLRRYARAVNRWHRCELSGVEPILQPFQRPRKKSINCRRRSRDQQLMDLAGNTSHYWWRPSRPTMTPTTNNSTCVVTGIYGGRFLHLRRWTHAVNELTDATHKHQNRRLLPSSTMSCPLCWPTFPVLPCRPHEP